MYQHVQCHDLEVTLSIDFLRSGYHQFHRLRSSLGPLCTMRRISPLPPNPLTDRIPNLRLLMYHIIHHKCLHRLPQLAFCPFILLEYRAFQLQHPRHILVARRHNGFQTIQLLLSALVAIIRRRRGFSRVVPVQRHEEAKKLRA